MSAEDGITRQDKRIARLAMEEGKGLVIYVNKIDCVEKTELQQTLAEMKEELAFCKFASMLPCSAHTREGLLPLFDTLEVVSMNQSRHIELKHLNDWYQDILGGSNVPSLNSSKYITQTEDVPPTFVLFVRDPKRVQLSELRYVENRMRETFAFEGTPILFVTKENNKN